MNANPSVRDQAAMPIRAVSKLALALITTTLVLAFGDGAFTSKPQIRPPPVAPTQEQPPPDLPSHAPRQLFPEKRVRPLTPEIEQSLLAADSSGAGHSSRVCSPPRLSPAPSYPRSLP
jgi:hypothetical protein